MSNASDVAPDGIMGAAITTVIDQIDKLDSIAVKYRNELSSSLADIKNVKIQAVDPLVSLPIPEIPQPSLNIGAMPTYQGVAFNPPAMPEFKNIDDLLSDLELSDLDIPDMPSMPSIQMPDKPGFANVIAPEKPSIETSVTLPDAPELRMPELAELVQIDIPNFQFPTLDDFSGVPPSLDSVVIPNVFIEWKEPQYQSEMLETIQSFIKGGLKGGTGLPPDIEEALFNRSRVRESRETERAVQEVVNEWASRNFSMPQGMQVKQIDAIREQGRLRASEHNREVLIEAAKFEIENIRFLVEQGMALEQLLSNLYSNTANRLFEAAKFNAESQISVFNAQVALFNAQNAAFETLAMVYKTKLDGALAKLSAYKTAVDAQAVIGQINEQHVQVYRAKIEAVMSNVELYKATMQGASIKADVIKNQFDAYRTEVQAYGEEIQAQKTRVEAYSEEVRAETAKVGLFETQARAYASTIQGIQAKADIKSKGISLKMEAARTWVSKYGADMEGYKAGLQASLNEVQLNTSVFVAQVEAWKSGASINVSEAEMQSRYAETQARTNISYSEMKIKEFESKLQHSIQEAQLALESAKALGQYSSQLAAGAMSAAHVSASISGSGSASTSNSKSNSFSESHSYTY